MQKLYCLLLLAGSSSALNSRGIPPEKLDLYSGQSFTCFDGSKTISSTAINDDYCDCNDGSDEPGTSACSNFKFYCANDGHIPAFITSSRVNDGLCEEACCDGSDEYTGIVKCPNVCKEAHQEHLRLEEERNRERNEGLKQKAKYFEYGERFKPELEKEIKNLEKQINQETTRLESLEKEKKRAQHAADSISDLTHIKDYKQLLVETKQELMHLQEELSSVDSQFEELRLLVGSEVEHSSGEYKDAVIKFAEFWDNLEFHNIGQMKILTKDFGQDSVLTDEIPIDEMPISLFDSLVEYYERYGNSLYESVKYFFTGKKPAGGSPSAKVQQAVSDATNKYNDLKQKIEDLKSKLAELTNKLTLDFGPNNIFAKLYGECFEGSDDQHTYQMCFYKEAKQMKDGSFVSSLGTWEQFTEDNYSILRFTKGTHCWNGPQRSLHVYLECGPENKVISVGEPNKCEYEMRMKTPVICQ